VGRKGVGGKRFFGGPRLVSKKKESDRTMDACRRRRRGKKKTINIPRKGRKIVVYTHEKVGGSTAQTKVFARGGNLSNQTGDLSKKKHPTRLYKRMKTRPQNSRERFLSKYKERKRSRGPDPILGIRKA